MLVLIAASFAATGCEPEDPKLRQEVAELRTRAAELERDNARMAAELSELRAKVAQQPDFLPAEALAARLRAHLPQVRAALSRAFAGHTVDPVNAGVVTTPLDDDARPYTSEITFGLSKGQQIESYAIRISADRRGNWMVPDAGALAEIARGASASPAPQSVGAGRGAMAPGGVRQIEWGDAQASMASSPAAAPQPVSAPVSPPAGTGGNAPFPVQDTRTIQFE